jgi:hypothetical protein
MTARIDYLSWPATEIAGGIKISFRHVEALRQAGLDAVIATPGAEPPGWFQSAAPIIDVAQASRDDILVFPENHYALLDAFAAWPNRKLVFCQNQFMVVRGLGGLGGRRDYAEFGVSGILCAGRSVADFCRLRFPSMPIAIVPVGIDQTLFRPQRDKKLQIAFAAHKRPLEAAFIWDLFCAQNPEFASLPWVEMRGLSEEQVAAVLGQSAVCLALCRFESFSMTIIETLASGCVTAGFTGFGARQFTTARNGFWAEEDDCTQCAELLAQAVRLVAAAGPRYADLLEAARDCASYYTRERMDQAVVDFWKKYLQGKAFC